MNKNQTLFQLWSTSNNCINKCLHTRSPNTCKTAEGGGVGSDLRHRHQGSDDLHHCHYWHHTKHNAPQPKQTKVYPSLAFARSGKTYIYYHAQNAINATKLPMNTNIFSSPTPCESCIWLPGLVPAWSLSKYFLRISVILDPSWLLGTEDNRDPESNIYRRAAPPSSITQMLRHPNHIYFCRRKNTLKSLYLFP